MIKINNHKEVRNLNYYKLIQDDLLVGVSSSSDFRRFQKKHQILLLCDEAEGQYLQCGETLYHGNWMRPITTDAVPHESAEVIAIDQDEYNALNVAIEKNGPFYRIKTFLEGIFKKGGAI